MAITKSTPAPLTGGTLWCVTIALSLATFMQMLDSTISNVAIPTISGFLGASTDEGTFKVAVLVEEESDGSNDDAKRDALTLAGLALCQTETTVNHEDAGYEVGNIERH